MSSAKGANDHERPVLVTGGAGFVGTNLADALLRDGVPVTVLDDLSRPGVEANLAWLQATHGDRVEVLVRDLTDAAAVREPVARASRVFHLAAQVAVTTSLTDPLHDFDTNLRGTLAVLEAMRGLAAPPPLVFTSTNKVYGALAEVALREGEQRYEPRDDVLRDRGVSERVALDFRSPYGCSKGAADQYVLDYARSYGLPAVVFRMSCIYGPHQWGTEDQGWVAHFVRQALAHEAITIYGDGKQVRDLLWVGDLVRALRLASDHAPALAGRAFNIGGGPDRSASLLEILDLIQDQGDGPTRVRFEPWRPGDQRYYVSDTGAFREAVGWAPQVGVRDGVAGLYAWLRDASARGGAAEAHDATASGPKPVAETSDYAQAK